MPGPRTTLHCEDGVAIITLDNPPVNALHPDGRFQDRIKTSIKKDYIMTEIVKIHCPLV
jgi:hypothetical protein